MRICALADVPEVIPLLATWFNNEWRAFDGRSTRMIEAQLTENLNRDSIPITFLALDASRLIGTVSLDRSDLPSHDHLSPWLASLYVWPEARRLGAGSALVRHLQRFALSHGCDPLYLWTPGATRLYQRCGWTITQRATYNSQPITIMAFTYGNAYVASGNAERSESDASPSSAWASSGAHRALFASARPEELRSWAVRDHDDRWPTGPVSQGDL